MSNAGKYCVVVFEFMLEYNLEPTNVTTADENFAARIHINHCQSRSTIHHSLNGATYADDVNVGALRISHAQ